MSDLAALTERYLTVRGTTVGLTEPLEIEDYVIQSMADVSPPKWHLAHTTWFFETFVLIPFAAGYCTYNEQYKFLFNSYYRTVGEFHLRPERGSLSRPTVAEVMKYREHVDDALVRYVQKGVIPEQARDLIQLGLHHEQQHQELLLMDIKYNFSRNPLYPVYRQRKSESPKEKKALKPAEILWNSFEPQLVTTGAQGDSTFHFDNEAPAHKNWLPGHALRNLLVTNREYLAFIRDGGYDEPLLWLSDGFDHIKSRNITCPEYWRLQDDGHYWEFQLTGMAPLRLDAPVQHISYYEADAFARWSGARLPTEPELEHSCRILGKVYGHFLDKYDLEPRIQSVAEEHDLLGNLWEWTSTAYHAYPGYRIPEGPVGEYNAKFMAGTMVLKGGSYLTPADHIRPSYRNFFYPTMRWQAAGIRLARDHTP